ncbi:MAG: helix-turn-helix transcriptional regulator [Deltaproteobacteria bacterium]|nr:helix-turn-helix transcriptional regulator [Deltaproteobacteria bacterium]
MRGALHTQRYRRFLDRLKNARVEAGLTQAEAAAKLKKPQSFVSKCEAGERRVDVIELEDFAKAYGRPILSFFRS